MKEVFKRITGSVILLSILAIVLGIVLIAYPGASLTVLGIAVAAYLIVSGIVLIILDIRAWRLYIPYDGMLLGIVCVILGVLLAKSPDAIAVHIGIVMGVWIIFAGFAGVRLSVALRWTSAPWVLMLIMSILDILIGASVLYSPVLSSVSLTMAVGIVLVVHSVINVVYMIVARKNVRDVEKLVVEKLER